MSDGNTIDAGLMPAPSQNTFSSVKVGASTISADSSTDTIELIAGSNVTLTPDTINDTVTIAATDTTYSVATASTSGVGGSDGLMTATDKEKLNGVAIGAEVNQNAFSNVKVGNSTIEADSKTDTIELIAGTNITLTPDATNDTVTITHMTSGATTGSYGDSGNQTPNYGGTFKVPYVTVNDTGHVTSISEHTVRIPASDNTNTTYTLSGETTSATQQSVKLTPSSGNANTIPVVGKRVEASSKVGEVFNSYSGSGVNTASGDFSHAEGYNTTASESYSHAEGRGTTASGGSSHAEGQSSTASGSASHAEGYGTAASNSYAHAEGYGTTASGSSSHAEGQDSTASGNLSHAEGYNTQATHSQAHAEGRYTKAQASEAHAEGNSTTASNSAAHAEGDNTTASGNASHSEGMNTTASSAASHAEGLYTIAASANQHVEGKYNISDSSNKYAHIIGNGTGENSRSNAFAVDWNGEIYTNNRTDSIQDEIGVIANLGAKNFYKIEGIYPDVGTANSIVINADQTITYTQISVATSDVTKKFVANPFTLPAGKYILTCAENESFSTYDTYLYNEDLSPASTIARGIEGYQEFTLTQPTNVNLYFRVRANYQYSTITLKPMIRRAEIEDDTFMPYAPTNRELYEDKINIGDVFGIGADIPENSDLNNYTTIGIYRCARSSTAQTLSNCPTNQAFKLEVRITAAETRLSQVIYSNSTIPEVYVRTYTTNGWSLWYPYVSTINMLVNTGVKNLIIPTNPASISGVTVTRNDDGSLTFVCTSVSENKLFKIGDFAVPNASKIYILSGCSGGSTSTYMLGIYDGSTAKIYQTTDEVAYTGNLSTYIARVRIIAGYTGTFTVYPMLRDASVVDSTYKQYGMTNPELTRRSNAVPELVNNGSKNLATVTSGTNSADRFAIIPFSSDAPAGYYCLSIGNLVSDDTDASTCYFAAYDSSGTAASAVYQLTRGQNIVQSLVTTRPTAFLRLYPSDNSSHSANDTVTFTDLMFCSEADWQASKSYIDYLPSNKEINAEINTLVNTGSKNMIFGTDLQRIKNANTSGTWTNNVYVYNNVEYTVNSDGTVSVKTLNGASTAAGSLLLPCKPLTGSAVILSGCPAGSNAGANFNLRWGSSSTYMDIGAGKTITTTGTNDVYLRVGDAINIPTAILFKPMMRDATITDNTFVMYAPSLPDIANWEEYDVLYRTSTTAADLLDMTNSSATLRVNRALKTACLNFSVKVKTGKTIPSTQSAFNFVTITGVTNYKEIYINQPARTYIINSSYTVTIAKGAGNAVASLGVPSGTVPAETVLYGQLTWCFA